MSTKIIFKFLPIKSSFQLGFVSANDKAMVAMRTCTANTASSFLTPYIVLKKEKHETVHHRNNRKKQINLRYQLKKQGWDGVNSTSEINTQNPETKTTKRKSNFTVPRMPPPPMRGGTARTGSLPPRPWASLLAPRRSWFALCCRLRRRRWWGWAGGAGFIPRFAGVEMYYDGV